ncbi:hypothetical protein SAMN05428985_10217 [Nocardioides sp. YR527]|uniref:hypothetical protein n=1 Tax=Nocardioides sp. YR527 TaxID=1881028 RepID=UPI00087F7DE4|nr:hypothetical protein [Nocardioides sp. YR527]SDJ95947.1 hypothetical protein SAMN05428985_10217 [Nocardioides sp. YR527]
MLPTHGIGGAQDLPIPASYAITGAGVALVISFGVLLVAWRRPRFDGAGAGRPLPAPLAGLIESTWLSIVARVIGIVLVGYAAWAMIWGPDLALNPIFGIVYVLLWVGLVPASLVLGPVWRAISPLRTFHRGIAKVAGTSPREGLVTLPSWVGYWPATVGLFAFVWLELVNEQANYLATVQTWFAVWAAALIIGAAVFGDVWFERADPFEVYSTLIAQFSPVGRRSDGQLVWQWPLVHLDAFAPSPSRVAVVAVLLGSTAYDSFSRSQHWVRFSQAVLIDMTLLGTLTLLAFCVFVGATFSLGTMATAVPPHLRRTRLPALFAHSVVPIIVGYVIAHYLTLLLEFGQQVLIQLSDPMVIGANLLGTADWTAVYFLSEQPTTLATIKVLAVLAGHILGVIAAHDRAVRLLPRGHQATGQLALLVVMLVYTVGGLYLLFSG